MVNHLIVIIYDTIIIAFVATDIIIILPHDLVYLHADPCSLVNNLHEEFIKYVDIKLEHKY